MCILWVFFGKVSSVLYSMTVYIHMLCLSIIQKIKRLTVWDTLVSALWSANDVIVSLFLKTPQTRMLVLFLSCSFLLVDINPYWYMTSVINLHWLIYWSSLLVSSKSYNFQTYGHTDRHVFHICRWYQVVHKHIMLNGYYCSRLIQHLLKNNDLNRYRIGIL